MAITLCMCPHCNVATILFNAQHWAHGRSLQLVSFLKIILFVCTQHSGTTKGLLRPALQDPRNAIYCGHTCVLTAMSPTMREVGEMAVLSLLGRPGSNRFASSVMSPATVIEIHTHTLFDEAM